MPTAPRPPLTQTHWLILGFWLLVAVVFTIISVASSRGDTGWEDLLAFLAVLLLVFAVAALVVVWAVARYLMSDSTSRVVFLVLGPPALMVLLVFALRLIS